LIISGGHFFNFSTFSAERADGQSIPQSSFGAFTNHGEFVKLGAGTLGVSVGSFASTAGSAIDVLAGQLHITNTGGYAGTALTVAAGAALRWTGGAHTLDAASSLSAPEMFFSAATVTFNGLYDVPGLTTVASGTVNFNAATLLPELTLSGGSIGGSGELTVPGTFNWSGGTLAGGTGSSCWPTVRCCCRARPP
jgi:fibronectin-binding autotransporter adhesin